MRELTANEVHNVSGGTTAAQAAANVCRANNLPADTKVTITITTGGSLGMGSTSASAQTTVTIETTCGDLTKNDRDK